MKPLIALTPDYIDPAYEKGGEWYTASPWYALREQYCLAVEKGGGIPFILPYYQDYIDDYLTQCKGVVITGGGFDIPPTLYGKEPSYTPLIIREKRTSFEWNLLKKAIEKNKPILGICGGMQLLNVFFGGTLLQHIPADRPSNINHQQSQERHRPQHAINVHKDSLLHRIVKTSLMTVNSVHHQGVDALGKGLIANAHADDGMVEGLEYPKHPFCLGLQWHPEFYSSPFDEGILEAFIEACCHD